MSTTTTPTRQLLTNSRVESFKSCRKKHWFAYEEGIRRVDDAKALRMGSAGHAGVEVLGLTGDLAKACEAVDAHYSRCPDFIPVQDWKYEHETIIRLVCGYEWMWSQHRLTYLAVERVFQLPLLNPQSGKPTPNFDLAGKMDAIVGLEDSRLAVKETKFLGEDIAPDADLWKRMRMDGQVTLYVNAARRLGFDVDTVLYDVVRKPTIRPEQIPVLDELGAKIVLDAQGGRVKTERGLWRQTSDKDRGYILQTRDMTTEEWGEKLSADIAERPSFYFSRVEIPRLQNDLDEFDYELWDIQLSLRDAQRNDRWYRTVNRNTCPHCDFYNLCSSGFTSSDALPDGFHRVYAKHPELEENANVVTCSPSSAAPAPTAIANEFTATGR